MATISITIPDEILPRVLNAICIRHGYTTESGLTKAQFARQVLIGWVREAVRLHEAALAHEQAGQKANDEITLS